jgi:hypothetical protein
VSLTWLSPVTYTTSANTNLIHYQPYSSSNSTATVTWTQPPLPVKIDDPCPDCTDGSVLCDGQTYPCPACDGTGMTWHYASEEEDL